jgi:Ca2+-binding RTX toxin-like protein
MAATFSITRNTTRFHDSNGNGVKDAGELDFDFDELGVYDPGDILYTRIKITNTGDQTATGVTIQDSFAGSSMVNASNTLTTYFANISPIAFNDTFQAIGNTVLRVGPAGSTVSTINGGESTSFVGSLISNDVGSLAGDSISGFQIDVVGNGTFAGSGVTAKGGHYNIFADGSFNYVNSGSDASLTDGDSFTYTIRDKGFDGVYGTADDLTSTATATITFAEQSPGVSHRVWYVDSGAAAGGDGTSANPFQTLAALNGAANNGAITGDLDQAGEYIYVENGAGAAATGPITLENGQQLIGTGANLVVAGFTLATAGSNSTIGSNATNAYVVTVGTNNTIAGLNIVGNGTNTGGITDNQAGSFGTLSLNPAALNGASPTYQSTVSATGAALNLSDGALAGNGFSSVTSSSGTNNISFNNITGTVNLGGGALTGASGASLNMVSSGAVNGLNVTYSGNITQGNNAALLNVDGGTNGHSGTLTLTGTLSATNGTGLQFNNADGTYNLNGTNTMNGGDAGIDIQGGSNGTFGFSSNTSITNPTGISFRVDGGNGNITYNGTITDDVGQLVSISNRTGGTVDFNGLITDLEDGDGGISSTQGSIDLENNTGATIRFDGGVRLSTGANDAFQATGGGTVVVTDSDGTGAAAYNRIATTSGNALEVSNTFIGANGLTFLSISSNGAPNGILLANTGTTLGTYGGLTVTGDTGSAKNGSGGTITNSTAAGISITGARDISLDQMTVSNNGTFLANPGPGDGAGDGIYGNNVVHFSLTNSTVTNNGNEIQEHGIEFINLTGNSTFSNLTVTNNEHTQIKIINTTGVANISVTNSTLSSTGTLSTPNGSHGLHVETQGTASADLTVTGTAFDNLFSNSIHATNEGTGTFEITIANSTFNSVGASAINIAQNNSGTTRFYIHDNGTAAAPTFLKGVNNAVSSSININQAGGTPAGAILEGAISNNYIGNSTAVDSASASGAGVRIFSIGSGTTNVRIDNNNIQGVNNGILVSMGEDPNPAHTINATIFNNTVSVTNSANGGSPFLINAGTTSSNTGDKGIMRLDMHDNTVTANASGGNADFRVVQRFGTEIQLLNYGGAKNDNAAVQTYFDVTRANNPLAGGNPDWDINQNTGGAFQPVGLGFTSTASVPQPTLPSPTVVVAAFLEPVVFDQPKSDGAGLVPVSFLASAPSSDAVQVSAGETFSQSGAGTVMADSNAIGRGRFVAPTLDDDNQFAGSGTKFTTADMVGIAGPRLDQLSIPTGEQPVTSGPVVQTSTPAPAPAPVSAASPAGPVVVDDGILTQAELDFIVDAAIGRWAAAGASDEQIAAMRAVKVSVSDLAGLTLGQSGAGTIVLDSNAAGWNWFVDSTPGDDSEYAGSGSKLSATDNLGLAGTRIDLLTVLTHELGHQIGLADISTPGSSSELMYGTIAAGERRLPGSDDLSGATGAAVTGAFAFAPVTIGSIPAGQVVTVEFRHVIDNSVEDRLVGAWTGQSTLDSDQTNPQTSNAEIGLIDGLALGDFIFNDVNRDGDYDAGTDTAAAGVTLTLYADTNNDGDYDDGTDLYIGYNELGGGAGYQAGIDTPAAAGTGTPLTTTTNASGIYSFSGLAPGNYIVRVNASNFQAGGALFGKYSTILGGDPNLSAPNDNNGEQFLRGQAGTYAASRSIRLDYGLENVAGPTGPALDTNNSLDLGFVANVAPVANADSLTATEDTQAQYSTELTGNDTDADLDTLTVTAVSNFVNGTASVSGGVVTFTPTANFNGTAKFDYTISDGNGHTATATATVTVSAVSDPVTGTAPSTASLNEDATNVAISGMSISDVDAALAPAGVYDVTLSATHGTLTLTTTTGLTFGTGDGSDDSTMTFHGTLAAINTALATAKFTPDANYNGSAQITLQVTDTFGGVVATGTGSATSDTDTVAVTVTSVNDAPEGADSGAAATQGLVYTFLTTDFSNGFSDPNDSPANAFSGIKVTTLPSTGTIKLNGTAIVAGAEVTKTQLDNGNLTYEPAAGSGGTTPTFTFQVRDNGGVLNGGVDYDQSANTFTLTIGGGNAAPALDLNGGGTAGLDSTAAYTEQSGPSLLAPAAELSDADDTMLESATVTITAGFLAGDTLTVANATSGVTGTGNAISFSYNALTGVLTLTGTASLADYQAALRTVAYEHSGDAPGSARTITIKVNDGTADSNVATSAVTITDVNDAPINQVGAATIAGTEDTDLLFTGGNSLSVVDFDADNLSVTLSVGHGTLTLSGTAGLVVTGDGTATVTLSGSKTAINAALDGLKYRGALNYEGTDTLTFTTSDNGNTGSGGVLTDTDTVTITLADDGALNGGGGDDTLTGTSGGDRFILNQGGNDTVNGLGGNDTFYFGSAFTADDRVTGGEGNDVVQLLGNYNLTLGADTMTGVERLTLFSGSVEPANNFYDYSITTNDNNVAAGETLTVLASSLRAGEDLVFNGMAETNGKFYVQGGAGADTLVGGQQGDTLRGGDGMDVLYGLGGNDILVGGAGADTLRGGTGNDVFRFEAAGDSVTGAFDTIQDFQKALDKIDLSQIDADTIAAGDQAFSFIGSNSFGNHAGELRTYIDGGLLYVAGDVNGDGTADFVIQVNGSNQPLTGADFFL